jgi:hypothetical protein
MNDNHAYEKYPNHRNWFNKLWVAERLGYDCGPSGVTPRETKECIVRPIYNLAGMGVGARFQTIKADNYTSVEPGYFWCERFFGRHISASFKFHHGVIGEWKPISAFEGFINPYEPLTKFQEWKRLGLDWVPEVPRELNELSDVDIINVEFIGGKVIEVHLRDTPDPDYDHLIPVWASDLSIKKQYMEENGYDFIESYDNADGHLKDPRIGFLVK